jgi:hypothetical protein
MSEIQDRSKDLEALFVEEGEQAVDSKLRTVLEGYVGFTRDGRIVTKPAFLKLSQQSRILVALLARQAMVRLKLEGALLERSAESLQEECLIPLKSCREYLSRLKKRRLIEKNASGYFVPIWAISTVAEALQAEEK